MIKKAVIVLGFLILTFFGVEIFSIWKDNSALEAQYREAVKQLEAAKKEKGQLEADLSSFSIPENLDKELRARFHYQAPGEKVLILVPRNSTSTTSTSP